MSNSELFTKPFPVDDNVIVKLAENTDIFVVGNQIFKVRGASLYNSSQEFVDKLVMHIYESSTFDLFVNGIKIEILEPGKQWKSGKVRCRMVFEFIPDEHYNNSTHSESISPLDDLRKMNL